MKSSTTYLSIYKIRQKKYMNRFSKHFFRIEFYVLLLTFIFSIYFLNLNFWQSDKEIFIFFATHYKQNWFSLQDNHIGGITYLNTYPPLVFQTMALISYIVPFNISYIILMMVFWFLLSFYSTKFFLSYTNREMDKKYFWLIFLFIYFAVGMFRATLSEGWLTAIVGLTFAFISLNYFSLFIRNKNNKKMFFILPFIITAFASPHIFVYLMGIYSFIFIFEYRLIRKKIKLIFLVLFFLLEIIFIILIFNLLSVTLKNQNETYHPSRDPLLPQYIQDWFYAHFGISLLMLFIFLFYKPLRKFWSLYLIACLLLLIGLGRTTPLPKIIFDGIEKWIVYDKLLFLSSLFLTFFLGFFIVSLIGKYSKGLTGKIVLSLILIFYLIFNLSEILIINPFALSKIPEIEDSKNFVLNFLNSQPSQYRYQTFGYVGKRGDFYLNTKMATLDTDYTSFQSIDILKKNGIRHINDIRDEKIIQYFFNTSTEYSVKYVITFNDFYNKIASEQKWKIVQNKTFNGFVENFNVTIWQNPNELKPIESAKENITIFNYLWGTVPLIPLFIFITMFIYNIVIKKYS